MICVRSSLKVLFHVGSIWANSLGEILFCANLYKMIKLSLFNVCREGDATKLMVDLIVNPTNESLTDKNPLSERIHKVAGPLLREECRTTLQSRLLFYIFLGI